LKRRPRRKKRSFASSSPPIHLRLRWRVNTVASVPD
jgi:hypothetical protein